MIFKRLFFMPCPPGLTQLLLQYIVNYETKINQFLSCNLVNSGHSLEKCDNYPQTPACLCALFLICNSVKVHVFFYPKNYRSHKLLFVTLVTVSKPRL